MKSIKQLIKVTFFLFFLIFSGKLHAQSNQWTWMSGDSTVNEPPVYGIKGMVSTSNKPGARVHSISWTDASGNFWLHGGYSPIGSGNYLNDLWKWDGTNWTWISGDSALNTHGVYGTKGLASPSNKPGARYSSISWTDASGNFWLHGGLGYAGSGVSGYLNDLWKWDGTNWTWISGDSIINVPGVFGLKGTANPANKPSARNGAVSWLDASGNFYLFGGSTNTHQWLNDLWKWDGTNWTWISGDNVVNQDGVYGIKGTPNPANKPNARIASISWIDNSGNLWLYGGFSTTGYINDLWKWDGTNWTWVSGSKTGDEYGIYGTKGIAASTNVPGARQIANSWKDGFGNFWLHGGHGAGEFGSWGKLNDLWKWDGTNWTWVSGDKTADEYGIYGTKGIASSTNKPSARLGSISFFDGTGNLWLYGGSGKDRNNNYGILSDLWKYSPDISSIIVTAQDGDWETPSTWLGNVVPVLGDSAKVKHNVNVTATTGKVKINKLILDNTAGQALITINSMDSFIVTKEIVLTGTSTTNPAKMAVSGTSILKTANLELKNNVSGSIVELELNGNSKVILTEDLTMDALASGEVILDLNASSNLCLSGTIERPNNFGASNMEQGATVTYNGTAAQTFTTYDLGAGDLFGHANVKVDNAAGLIMETGNGGALLTDTLTFVNGMVNSSLADQVVFSGVRAFVKDASNSMHINGPVKKIGAGAFKFPTGKDGKLGRIEISDPGATGDFTGEYYRGLPSDTVNHASTIKKLSSLEYWDLTRNNGAASVYVTLHWERADSAGISKLSDLRVCHYTGGIWKDEMQSATTGGIDGNSGSITSASAITSFSPFTFGSGSITANPLPVEIINFTVNKMNNNMANIKWTTATEENADYFEVQRSTDGANFTTIGIVNAQGNSNQIVNYTFLDEGLNQVHSDVVYYRLREVDYDENDFYSNIQNLKLDPTLETKLVSNLYPNPFNNEVTLSLNSNNSELEILVTDLLGSIKYEKIIIGQNSQKYSLDLSELATGVYTITVISNGQKETYKTIKK